MIPSHIVGVSLFDGIPEPEAKLLAKKFVRESFPADKLVFGQGDAAHRFYVLVEGRISIEFKPEDGEMLKITEIEPGGIFGWSAALGRSSYTSSAKSTEPSEVLSIRGSELRRLCSKNPDVGVVILERLAEVIAERLESTREQIVELFWANLNSTK